MAKRAAKPQRPTRSSRPSKAQKRPGASNTLRIIAGKWRGRKLAFANVPGLRPTPDRVRETLFNWLQGHLLHGNCLDLFTGSGALGFEAVSRGAASVTMIESHHLAAEKLRQNIALLGAGEIELFQQDAMRFLQSSPAPFDIIFLDPPFRKDFVPGLLQTIRQHALLKADGLIYLEHEAGLDLQHALQGFDILKEKEAGQVVSRLLRPNT